MPHAFRRLRLFAHRVLLPMCVLGSLGLGPAVASGRVEHLASLPAVAQVARPAQMSEAHGVLVAQRGQAVDVFIESGSGQWDLSEPAATLDVAPGYVSHTSTNGSTVIVGSSPAGGGAYVVQVYSEPAGGWVGPVAASATLTPPAGYGFDGGAAMSAHAIAISAVRDSAEDPTIETGIYAEPAGGWSGTVGPAATLVARAQSDGGAQFVGNTVWVSTDPLRSREYAFTMPAGGWAGVVGPSGQIITTSDGGIAVGLRQGACIAKTRARAQVGGLELFRLPSAHGTSHPRVIAHLVDHPEESQAAAISQELIAVQSVGGGDASPTHSKITLITRPPHGWSGTLVSSRAVARAQFFSKVALEGRTLFLENQSGAISIDRVIGSEGHQRNTQAVSSVAHDPSRRLGTGEVQRPPVPPISAQRVGG